MEYNNNDPSIKYILQNFDKFNNTKIFFSGNIEDINTTNHEIKILVPIRPWFIMVKIPNNEELPQKGDKIEVYGVLDGRTHVTAERILVSKSWEYNLIFYRSYLAIPFVLFLFFRTWRINIKKFRFERRKKDA
jgi:hypothetical protein